MKLDLLESMARSQRALAVMMEQLAGLAGSSCLSPERVERHLAVLARHQVILTERITGVRLVRITRGCPGKPWLHRKVRVLVRARAQRTEC